MNDELSWSEGKYRHSDTQSILIENASHCTDMYLSWTINDGIRE